MNKKILRWWYSVRSICGVARYRAEVYRAPPLTRPSGQARSNMDFDISFTFSKHVTFLYIKKQMKLINENPPRPKPVNKYFRAAGYFKVLLKEFYGRVILAEETAVAF